MPPSSHTTIDRLTNDLDYFATTPDAPIQLLPSFEAALTGDGLSVERLRVSDSFIRLQIGSGEDSTLVDLAFDARMARPVSTELGTTLSVSELAADKTLALFGRAAARDIVDVDALVRQFGWDELEQLATEKDSGFDRQVMVGMLRTFDSIDPRDFDLDDASYDQLRVRVGDWIRTLASVRDTDVGLSREPEQHRRTDRGRER
ncbi:MAG TPA: nucleotidyl transferase AbiEii/AbiGii toxin family protein [Mycobacteriales bacterium]|nr:nucleotidyl transferase AbiEii/AbiGii toxin family protein [Mycobacteriales bacterium]